LPVRSVLRGQFRVRWSPPPALRPLRETELELSPLFTGDPPSVRKNSSIGTVLGLFFSFFWVGHGGVFSRENEAPAPRNDRVDRTQAARHSRGGRGRRGRACGASFNPLLGGNARTLPSSPSMRRLINVGPNGRPDQCSNQTRGGQPGFGWGDHFSSAYVPPTDGRLSELDCRLRSDGGHLSGRGLVGIRTVQEFSRQIGNFPNPRDADDGTPGNNSGPLQNDWMLILGNVASGLPSRPATGRSWRGVRLNLRATPIRNGGAHFSPQPGLPSWRAAGGNASGPRRPVYGRKHRGEGRFNGVRGRRLGERNRPGVTVTAIPGHVEHYRLSERALGRTGRGAA